MAAVAHRRQDVTGRVRKGEMNLQHARDRDHKCMSAGTEMSWSRLQAAHVFSSSHLNQVRISFRSAGCFARTDPARAVAIVPYAPRLLGLGPGSALVA